MATLTGIFNTGDVGSVVPGIYSAWGVNPTINGKEYLATGVYVNYAAKYSNFTVALPGACFSTITNSHPSWINSTSTGGGKTFFIGNNYIHCLGNANDIDRGASFASAPTQESPTTAIVPQTGVNRDFFTFNNLLCFVIGTSSYNGNRGHIITTSGNGTYTQSAVQTVSANTNAAGHLGYFVGAASDNLAVAMNAFFDPNEFLNTAIVTSTNGTSWTARTPSISGLYPTRLAWVPAANAFVMVANTGAIYTTTDGFTLTSRTAPNGMLTSINTNDLGNQGLQASSPTTTLISIGSGKILKITGLTNYSILDYSAYFGNSLIYGIAYDGEKFIFASSTQNIFVSTDQGETLTKKFNIYNANVANTTQTMNAISYANSRVIGTFNYRSHDITSAITSSTPDLIGSSTASYFDPGVQRIYAYFRLT